MVERLPLVYPILDSSFIPAIDRADFLDRLGRSLTDAGVTLLEYRNKSGTDAEVLRDARILRATMASAPTPGSIRLVMDDRVDVALAAGFDGVHVDAGDLPPAEARLLMGDGSIVGSSASDETELLKAIYAGVDYIAFGPIFPTTTKQTWVAPMGIEGVRRFREFANGSGHGGKIKLVAAAGITLETAVDVLEAGADAVAVAAAIFGKANPAGEFKRWMSTLR